mmetsp:Transcript_19436/g.74542  ORF Transcript_19436/g.74542 Transcript_19436/m.74542 type:complete len:209 (-) Transcript_19436:146-772(-)
MGSLGWGSRIRSSSSLGSGIASSPGGRASLALPEGSLAWEGMPRPDRAMLGLDIANSATRTRMRQNRRKSKSPCRSCVSTVASSSVHPSSSTMGSRDTAASIAAAAADGSIPAMGPCGDAAPPPAASTSSSSASPAAGLPAASSATARSPAPGLALMLVWGILTGCVRRSNTHSTSVRDASCGTTSMSRSRNRSSPRDMVLRAYARMS